jgi:hypothetical protein
MCHGDGYCRFQVLASLIARRDASASSLASAIAFDAVTAGGFE